jgi:chemotaxis family two-component system response regulator Rcp1
MEFSDKKVNILLIEDNEGDVRLIQEAFRDSKIKNKFTVVNDGENAMEYLYKQGKYAESPRPDLIFLDLNLPQKSGLEILEEIKSSPELKRIPVVILTTSSTDENIQKSYGLFANCYITKPADFNQFVNVVKVIEEFWSNIAWLPL